MKKSRIIILIILMSSALVGVVFVQTLYVHKVYRLQQSVFNQGVHMALDEVRIKVEEKDFIASFHSQEELNKEYLANTFPKKQYNNQQEVEQEAQRLNAMQKAFYQHMFPETHANKMVEKSEVEVRQYQDSISRLKNQVLLLEKIAKSIAQSNVSLEKRIDKSFLEQTLHNELLAQGIALPFSYTVLSSKIAYIHSNTTIFVTPLFKKQDFGTEYAILELHIEGQQAYLWAKLWIMMLTSAFLFVILLLGLGYTLNTVIQQKKIADMKTEFINNMTHEFKTPISTIMIASEALQDEKMTENPQKIIKMAKIIQDENLRLSNHIERVLGIAKLELKEFELKRNTLNVHQIIQTVTENMRLQVEKKQGKIRLELVAEKHLIVGDELHFANVILNLIDNALKYSQTQPLIHIKTWQNKNDMMISIKDNGIGISKAQLSKIFEQFYRVPTGNVHNVKGFGLGLSYVQTILEKINGKITVKSEPNEGTEFTISIPLV